MMAAGAAACGRQPSAQTRGREDAAKRVKAVAVKQDAVRRSVDVVGTLAAVDEVTISAEAEGRVTRILADLGDRVHAGDMLVELDREKSEYNVQQQQASLTRALARFGAADTGHLPPLEETPDVRKAQAALVQAKQAFDRASELHTRQLVPKQTLDDADAAFRSRQADYESALQNAKNLRADIEASEASMRLAGRQLRDTGIRAPFDGYVQKRLVSAGEFVKNQTPVMSVVRVDPLKVIAEIPERMAPWIALGQPITLRVDAYPDKNVTGKVSRISPTVNAATRAFPFEGLVPNTTALLKPGTFARVHIESSRVDQVVVIAYSAIQYRYGVNRVFVVEGDHLTVREVKVGERDGDRIEIAEGLRPGDRVVPSDVDRLVDGMKVTVSDAL